MSSLLKIKMKRYMKERININTFGTFNAWNPLRSFENEVVEVRTIMASTQSHDFINTFKKLKMPSKLS